MSTNTTRPPNGRVGFLKRAYGVLVVFVVMIRNTIRSPSAEVGFHRRAYGALIVFLMRINPLSVILVLIMFWIFFGLPIWSHAAGIPKQCLDFADKQQRAAVALKKSEAMQKDAWAEGIITCMEATDKLFGIISKGPGPDTIDINILQQSYEWACSGKNGVPLPRRSYEVEYCTKKKMELDLIRQVQAIQKVMKPVEPVIVPQPEPSD